MAMEPWKETQMKSKIISAQRAADLIKDGVTIAWTS
jgi:hypothetical protein